MEKLNSILKRYLRKIILRELKKDKENDKFLNFLLDCYFDLEGYKKVKSLKIKK